MRECEDECRKGNGEWGMENTPLRAIRASTHRPCVRRVGSECLPNSPFPIPHSAFERPHLCSPEPRTVNSHSSRLKRSLVLALKLAVLALMAWGIHRTAYAALDELERKHWSPAQLRAPWLILAGVLYLAGMLPSGWFWYRLLHVLGAAATLGRNAAGIFHRTSGKVRPRQGAGRDSAHRLDPQPPRRYGRGGRERVLRNADHDGRRRRSWRVS